MITTKLERVASGHCFMVTCHEMHGRWVVEISKKEKKKTTWRLPFEVGLTESLASKSLLSHLETSGDKSLEAEWHFPMASSTFPQISQF